MVWLEGDYFTCRSCGSELQVKKVGIGTQHKSPFYPRCCWCGTLMDIVTILEPQKEVGGEPFAGTPEHLQPRGGSCDCGARVGQGHVPGCPLSGQYRSVM